MKRLFFTSLLFLVVLFSMAQVTESNIKTIEDKYVGETAAVLTWDVVPGATGYSVTYDGRTVQSSSNHLTIVNLKPDTEYTCTVKANGVTAQPQQLKLRTQGANYAATACTAPQNTTIAFGTASVSDHNVTFDFPTGYGSFNYNSVTSPTIGGGAFFYPKLAIGGGSKVRPTLSNSTSGEKLFFNYVTYKSYSVTVPDNSLTRTSCFYSCCLNPGVWGPMGTIFTSGYPRNMNLAFDYKYSGDISVKTKSLLTRTYAFPVFSIGFFDKTSVSDGFSPYNTFYVTYPSKGSAISTNSLTTYGHTEINFSSYTETKPYVGFYMYHNLKTFPDSKTAAGKTTYSLCYFSNSEVGLNSLCGYGNRIYFYNITATWTFNPPTKVSLTSGGVSSLTGTWTGNIGGALGTYDFCYSTTNSAGSGTTVTVSNAQTKTVTGLASGTYYVWVREQYSGCTTGWCSLGSVVVQGASGPSVSTADATNVKYARADLNGTVTAQGTSVITEYGFKLGTLANNMTKVYTVQGAPTIGTEFTYAYEELTYNTTYYYTTYAISAAGESAPDVKSFTTWDAVAPTVTIEPEVTDITISSAGLAGAVTANGGAVMAKRGFVYSSTNSTPTLGGTGCTELQVGVVVGTFNTTLTGLTQKTRYYVRAYGQNTAGRIGYSDVIDFTTLAIVPPTATIEPVSNISMTQADFAGEITFNGRATVTERGFVYSSTNNTPTVGGAGCTKVAVGQYVGKFNTTVTDLTKGTHYYVRAYGYNSSGYGYSPVEEFTTTDIQYVLESNKDVYNVGEPVMVTAQGASDSWVAIEAGWRTSHYYCMWWYNVDDHPGTAVDIKTTEANHDWPGYFAQYSDLPAGRYTLLLLTGSDPYQTLMYKQITIGNPNGDVIQYSSYFEGEPIYTKGKEIWGENTDWVALYTGTYNPGDAVTSAYKRWYYCKDHNDVFYDITLSGGTSDLTAGDYTVFRLAKNDYQYDTYATFHLYTQPTNIAVSNITISSATVTWENGGEASPAGYDIYYTTSSTAPNINTTPSASVSAGVYSCDITGLNIASTYYIYVRPKATDHNGSWVSGGTFTTTTHQFTVTTNGKVGDPINVTAYAPTDAQTDAWVGIYHYIDGKVPAAGSNDYISIHWYSVNQAGTGAQYNHHNGETVDITNKALKNDYTKYFDAYYYRDFPVGTYRIYLIHDNYQVFTYQDVTISGHYAPENIAAPATVAYNRTATRAGMAGGTVTITKPASFTPQKYNLYWGDANGKLAGYSAFRYVGHSGNTQTYTIGDNVMTPAGATRILAYSVYDDVEGSTFTSVNIPTAARSRNMGALKSQFQVLSDIHINNNAQHLHDQHFVDALADIKAISPSTSGIFINGDIADHGNNSEYTAYRNYLAAAGFTAGTNVFAAIGNHDFYNGTTIGVNNPDPAAAIAQFLNGTGQTALSGGKVYFDKWIGDMHFIFLGSEAGDVSEDGVIYATISQAQINWFANAIGATNAGVKASRTFVFFHQGIKNTVAGTSADEGWYGIKESDAETLKEIMKNYPEAIWFTGHSHREMATDNSSFTRSYVDRLPNVFNTASNAYIWNWYDMVSEDARHGQGYFFEVYENGVVAKGYDFSTNEYIATAQFMVGDYVSTTKSKYSIDDAIMVTASSADKYSTTYDDWVGLYPENDIPNENTNQAIYWYYVKDAQEQAIQINTTTGSIVKNCSTSNPERWNTYKNLPEGKYKILLFLDGSYVVGAEKHFTVRDASVFDIAPGYIWCGQEDGEDIFVSPQDYATSGKTGLGVVFYLTPDKKGGWIISKEYSGKTDVFTSASDQLFGVEHPVSYSNSTDDAIAHLWDGETLTNRIPGTSDPRDFALNTMVTRSGYDGWYIPTAGQMNWLKGQKKIIETSFTLLSVSRHAVFYENINTCTEQSETMVYRSVPNGSTNNLKKGSSGISNGVYTCAVRSFGSL